MADNVTIPASGTGTSTPVIATDDVSSVHYQRVKLDGGGDGASTPILAGGGVEASAIRVTIASDSTGLVSVDDNGAALTVDNGGTFVTQENGAALTALQLIDDIVYTDDTSTHSTGSSKGALMMAAAAPTDASVNANDIGAVAMTTDRKLHVSVQDSLPAGTNAIGKLAANSGVDIGDVDITSIAAGDNNIGNVDIVTLPVATYVTKTVTIASGQSLSGATTDNSGYRLIALQMPAAWTTAAINFQGSVDGVTYGIWYTAYNSSAISVPSGGAVADNYVQVDWADTHAPPYLKVRSGTAASPVNQAADRTITLVFAPIR